MGRSVDGFVPVNANIKAPAAFDVDSAGTGAGLVPAALNGTVAVAEFGDEAVHKTVLTLTALDQLIPNGGSEFCGTELYDFPVGRIHIHGVTASLAPTTTTVIATSIASGATGTVSLGTVTDDGTHTGTKADLLPDGNFTSSTTINVAAAAVGKTLVAAAAFDGTSAAKKVFLNSKVATGSIDGHLAWSGNITITWSNLGTY